MCPRGCGKEARVSPLYGILPCLACIEEDGKTRRITKAPEFVTITQQTRIQEQRDRHEGDIIPPYDHNGKPSDDFRRLYPEKAKQLFDEYEKITGQKA